MNFDEYQRRARETDRTTSSDKGQTIAHFGLIGEVGSLLTVFKKRLRDGSSYTSFNEDLVEELGDVLWYTANICSRYDVSLNAVAEANLDKIANLWGPQQTPAGSGYWFDKQFPANEQIPRQFSVEFREERAGTGRIVRVWIDGREVGDPLTDNSYHDDGYRFHDIFHISYAVYLGWSPLLRHILGCKRKSDPRVDEVEDGARARIAEEAVSLFVYSYAYNHDFLANIDVLDAALLRGVQTLIAGLEVEVIPPWKWREAILHGYELFRQLRTHGGGRIEADLTAPIIKFVDP